MPGLGGAPAPGAVRKRKPPEPPPVIDPRHRAAATQVTTHLLRDAYQAETALPPEVRYVPTGETTTEWLARRWSGVLGRAGWDPTRLPIPLMHDLASAGVDDRMLIDAMTALAPLQEPLLERLRERNAQQAAAASMRPNWEARRRIQIQRQRMTSRDVEPDQSIVGWDKERLQKEMLGQAVPGMESPAQFQEGAERAREEFANRAIPFPGAVDNLNEIASTPDLRRRLDAAPWLLQFLTQQPQGEQGVAQAKASLQGYLQGGGKGLDPTLRQAAGELLRDGESPLGVAYMLAMWQTHDVGQLRQRGIVDPGQVLDRARMNAEETPRKLATATGGIIGREKLPLLAFDPRDELEQARLEASGQIAAVAGGLVHPGKILDGLNWSYDHVISPSLGTVVQLLKPINDALIVRRPAVGGSAPGPLVAGPGKPIVEWHPEAFGQLVTPAEAWRRAQTSGFGGAIAELTGSRPGDKDYAKIATVFDLVAGFYLDPLLAAGRIGAGVKAARTIPAADEVATSALLRRVTRLYPEAQIPEIPHSKLSRLAYQAFARNPEELVATSKARRTFESMAKEMDPVVIADRYHLPPGLADAIAGQRDPNRIRDLIVAGMRGVIPSFTRAETEAKILKNRAEIERLERLGGGTQPPLFPDQAPVNPYQPRINALRRQTAEMDADLLRNERPALEVRGMPLDTLAGAYRQAVKRFAPSPTRPGLREQGTQSLTDVLVRSSRSYEQRRLGQLDEATRVELDRHARTTQRWRKDLEELYQRRAAGDVGVDRQITDAEKALDRLAATTAGILERQGLGDQMRLWQARERFGRPDPAVRALSWAYNRKAQLRSPFELLPQYGDVISITDKAQGLRTLERLGQVLDVDRASLDDALRRYIRASGSEETLHTVYDLLRRARALHPEYTHEMLRLYRGNSESAFWLADADGRDMWAARKEWMGDEMPFSQPHLDSELLTEVPLPDWRAARDMRRLSTRTQTRIQTPHYRVEPDALIGRTAARFGVSPHRLTTVLRPLERAEQAAGTAVAIPWAAVSRWHDILLNRVWTPAVLLRGGWTQRVVGEEQLRMASVGLASMVFHPSVWWDAARAKGEFARFAERPEELLVSYSRELWGKVPTAMRIRKGDPLYLRAWRQYELMPLAKSKAMRVFLNHVANEGEGAGATAKTMRWLQGHPEGVDVWRDMGPISREVLGEAGSPIPARPIPAGKLGPDEDTVTLYRAERPPGKGPEGVGAKPGEPGTEGRWFTTDPEYAKLYLYADDTSGTGWKIRAVNVPRADAEAYLTRPLPAGKSLEAHLADITDPEFMLPEDVIARAETIKEGTQQEVTRFLSEHFVDKVKPQPGKVADDAVLMEKWIDTFRQRVHDKTRGNQALIQLVRDGELRMPIDELATIKFGGAVPRRLEIALEEYQDLLRAGRPIPHELRLELEHELGVGLIDAAGGILKGHVPLSDELIVEKFLDSLPDTAKPNFVKGRGYNWTDEAGRRTSWVAAAMDVLGGKPTTNLSRVPTFRQFATHEYGRLRGMGVSEARAEERARAYGIEQTRALLYELGEKSALADQLTVFSRFFNAWQEVTTRWLVDLPARQGIFGHAAVLRRFDLFIDAARESGLLYQNERGEWVTKLPGFDRLVSNVMGIPMQTEFSARGFNMLTQLPGLNPITLKALVELPGVKEQWDKPGPIKAFLDLMAPFGPEVNLGPAWLGRAWWAMSKGGGPNYGAPPWEVFSSKYQRMLWDGSVIDAMRVIDAKAKKDTGTSVLEALARMPEGPEKDARFQGFLDDAQSMGRHFFTLRAATGLLLPAQPAFYWPNNEEAQAFYTQLNALPEGSPARRVMYDQFIEDHPQLTSYLVGKSKTKPGTPRPVEPGTDEFSLRAYWRQVETGARERLSPQEWERYAAGAVDYQQINHDYRTEAAAAGDTAADRLRNYGKVLEASAARASRIERLRQTNPLWSAQFDIQIEGSRLADGQGRLTFEEHVAADFANDVKVITDLVNDTPLEDTVDLGELRRARRALLDKWGPTYNEIAGQDSVEGEVARYFRDTMDPYFEQLDGLYEQANALPRAERGPFYNQVRELRNTYQAPEGMPKPEEVLFGMADEQQQTELRWKWASQPPGWLSDFQRQTAGLPESPQVSQFWTTVNQVEAAVRGYIREQHWIPTQKQALDMLANFEQWKVAYADGQGFGEEVAREQLAPFDRAYVAKQLPEPYWQPVVQTLSLVKQALAQVSTNVDGTPASIDSIAGRPVFDAFAAWLDTVRARDEQLDTAFTRWGKILGDADQPLIGVDLYRVLLFGEFR